MKSINKKDLLLEIITTDKLRFKDNGVKFVNILCMICCVCVEIIEAKLRVRLDSSDQYSFIYFGCLQSIYLFISCSPYDQKDLC